jgi:hypothetical protein
MRCIAYISLESRRLGRSDLLDILRVARTRNALAGITGVLMYYDGLFLQVIEGDEAPLDELLGKLRGDRRHRDLRVLLDERSDERHFPDWAMALIDLATLPAEERWLCRHLDRPLPELQSDVLAERIRRLIGSFQAMVRGEGAPVRA